ncbi:MAG: preprotein translocase subunit SecA [Candidatus Makana argininalis]
MFKKIINNIFRNYHNRFIKNIKKIVLSINKLEKKIEVLNNYNLANKTQEFKYRIKNGESLNKILPEAFAVVREASKRLLDMRHFDVQLMGGIVLNNNCIAEMYTGEGKTLTATLPAYLNALTGKGVHIVTVNDYLADRDSKKNKKLFEFLNLTVKSNLNGMTLHEKRLAYSADITYGTNNEYGFDYLKDNMIFNKKDKVQRKLHFALLDEVDSILIDESRTPLVISGEEEDRSDIYNMINKIIKNVIKKNKKKKNYNKYYYSVDEKLKQVTLHERGLVLIENILIKKKIIKKKNCLYSNSNIYLLNHIMSSLKAHILFTKNIDYIIKKDKILIINENTGRIMNNQRWSNGLHQSIEAKENVNIQKENKILSSITFQNYFRLYEKLSGMTGTAKTESLEFKNIYKLNTFVIPTNKPIIRKDFLDLFFLTEKEKIKAIINDIIECNKRQQPVLVGTISIAKSELISHELKKIGIKHTILNAKFHYKEAEIISQAGIPGSVTIATNMAGRGTDIVLGGTYKCNSILIENNFRKNNLFKKKWQFKNKLVLKSGGLHVIGTEHHESRRIDNQLRGRSGRQGDCGSSRFYLSMEDSLIRIFASKNIYNIIKKLNIKLETFIEHPYINKFIKNAQIKVENKNFNIRKNLMDYDDIINHQRLLIYNQRKEFLKAKNINKIIENIRIDVINTLVNKYIINFKYNNIFKINKFLNCLKNDFNIKINLNKLKTNNIKNLKKENLKKNIIYKSINNYNKIKILMGNKKINIFEKNIMLNSIDEFWKEYLYSVDYLKQGINLRIYAQKNPKQEYKKESFIMFKSMIESLKYEVISILSNINN